MHIADEFAGKKLVSQSPRFKDEERNCGKKFRIPIQERVKHIGDHVAERTAVIDRGLPALGTVMAAEFCAAILAMRQSSRLIFASTEPARSGGSLDSGNRCV